MPRPRKPDELRLINMTTREVYDVEPPYENGNTWYKTTRSSMVQALHCLGDPKAAVFAELLRAMSFANEVNHTVAEIADEAGVSAKTVTRVLQTLEESGVIKRIRNGRLMVNPKVMRNGKSALAGYAKAEWEKLT